MLVLVGNSDDRFSRLVSQELGQYEPCHEKINVFAHGKMKTQISLAVTTKLIRAFVFANGIVQ